MGQGKVEVEAIVPLLNKSPRATQLMEVWPRKLEFDLDGETGPFYLAVEKKQVRFGDGNIEQADIVISGSTIELAKVMRGEKDVTHPIAHGDISLRKGNILDLLTFSRMLGAVRRKRLER